MSPLVFGVRRHLREERGLLAVTFGVGRQGGLPGRAGWLRPGTRCLRRLRRLVGMVGMGGNEKPDALLHVPNALRKV
jgi:hypothetical protein